MSRLRTINKNESAIRTGFLKRWGNKERIPMQAPMATIVYLDKDPTLQKGLENIVEGVMNLNDLCREK